MTETARSTKARARWSTQADDVALVDLVRACPMHGMVSMYFDRAPRYATLSELQGDGARVCVVDGPEPEQITATGALASFDRCYVDGVIRQATYCCDLRVHPDRRKGLVVKRIYDFFENFSGEQGWDLGFTAVMQGNDAMGSVIKGKGNILPYHHFATVRNYAVQFLLPKLPVPGFRVRRATQADIPEMVALWSRLQAEKQFAPAFDDASFKDRLERSPGLAITDYFLAFAKGRLLGFLATWNQASFKKMIVLGFAPEMLKMRRWYNPLSRVLGLAPIPEVGQAMPYFYTSQLCSETPEALRALLVAVYNAFRGPRSLFFSVLLDVKDPLIAAVKGFMTQQVDIELYIVDPQRKFKDHPFGNRPAYFDPAIV